MKAAPWDWALARWRWLALCVALAALALLGLGEGPPPGRAQVAAPPAERYRDLDSPLEEVRALATRLAEADARIVALEGAASVASVPVPPIRPAAPVQPTLPIQPAAPALPLAPPVLSALPPAPGAAATEAAGRSDPPIPRGLAAEAEDLPLLPAALPAGEGAAQSTASGIGGGHGRQAAVAAPAQSAAQGTLEVIPTASATLGPAPALSSGDLQWVGGSAEAGGGDKVLAPAGATLLDARLLTALIGRVPRNGTLVDPLPFKAVVGARNYFAPGVRLPGLRGALLRGETVGDLLLSCTRARITSISWKDGRGRWRQHTAQGGLGYLSDPQGSPCIAGRLFTSLRSAAIWAALGGGLAAASEAWVAARTAQSGLAGQLLAPPLADLGRAGLVQGGSEALSDWVGERLQDTFDAVIVPSGRYLVAHLEVPIPLDGR